MPTYSSSDFLDRWGIGDAYELSVTTTTFNEPTTARQPIYLYEDFGARRAIRRQEIAKDRISEDSFKIHEADDYEPAFSPKQNKLQIIIDDYE